jgi:prephenate dehydrogenase
MATSSERTVSSTSGTVVGIVGLGLIGGSIGLALRDSSVRVIGFDANRKHEETALMRQCVDEVKSLAEVAQADVVFIAVPPGAIVSVAGEISAYLRSDTVLTDCGSVKSAVAEWATKHKAKQFVPGHPMAGHEKGGPEYASGWLFRNARWLLTPTKFTDRGAIRTVEGLVKKMGATPVRLDASEHDRHVAVLSHLPHVLASELVLLAEGLTTVEVAGGSWRDWTRVAGVDPQLWTQIFMGNRMELGGAIDALIARLETVKEHLREEDAAAILADLKKIQVLKAAQEKTAASPRATPSRGKTRKVRK